MPRETRRYRNPEYVYILLIARRIGTFSRIGFVYRTRKAASAAIQRLTGFERYNSAVICRRLR